VRRALSLRSFLREMEERREVLHVKEQVSPRFEASSVMKSFDGGSILFFERVGGYDTKTVANVCGTRQRICHALNTSPEGLYHKLIEAWRSPIPPKIVEECPVKEVIGKPDLSKIPVLTHFERDAGPYITSAIVSARSLDGKIENVSVHRLQVLNRSQLAIRLVPRHLYKLWTIAKEAKRDLEVAIALGLHPAVSLSASTSVPFGVSEFGVANALLGDEMLLTKCEEVDAYAPAEAELVLEGTISVDKEVMEGPFVDLTGTYDVQRSQPVVDLVGMMHREDYVYQALLPSGAEHRLLMGLPKEVAIWESARNVVPTIKAVNMSLGGCGYFHCVISMEKLTDGDAKNVMMACFAADPSLKHVVVVDTDIDVFNPEDVEWAVATRSRADRSLLIVSHVRVSSLDPTADEELQLGCKMGIDATRPFIKPREKFEKARIPETNNAKKIIEKIKNTLNSHPRT